MDAYLLISAAALGAIAGSFLNALSFRFNTGRGMGGRSHCMHCGHTLEAPDLVPLFSFLALRGRCRHCGSKISLQYPLVEAAAAVLGALTLSAHPAPLLFAFWFIVWMTLLFVVVYDVRHTVIPWSCSGLLAALAVVYLIAGHHTNPVDVAAGPALALPLFLLSLVSGGRWMGWGDGALELGLGWLLGLTAGLTAFILAFWSGALVGIALIFLSRGVTMKSEMPFAPFLILGAFVVHFFHVDFFSTLGTLL